MANVLLTIVASALVGASVTRWWTRRMSKPSTAAGSLPLIAGKPEEWTHFASRHRPFLERFPELKTAVNLAFFRDFESDRPVDPLVFYMGRLCTEEFFEILLLCANGYGVGGLKLLRGVYERVVTMRRLSAHPDETDSFLDFHLVQNGKLARAALDTFGTDLTEEQRGRLEAAVKEYDRVKPQFMVPDCTECGTQRVNHTWSRLDFVAMARSVGPTGSLLVPCYYQPLSYAHSTAQAFLSRLKITTGDEMSFVNGPEREQADQVLMLAHNLLLDVLDLQRSHFKLDNLNEPLERCMSAFREIWA